MDMEHITKPFLGRFYATRARSGKRKKLFNLRFSLKVQVIRSLRFLHVTFLRRKAEYYTIGDANILKSKSTNVIHFNLIEIIYLSKFLEEHLYF